VLFAGIQQAGEQRGEATVEATGPSVNLPIALVRSGTGKAISGTGAPSNTDIYARCGDISRRSRSDMNGNFQIDDVGEPPCTLECLVSHEELETDAPTTNARGIPSRPCRRE
jgi:hypothetical protein